MLFIILGYKKIQLNCLTSRVGWGLFSFGGLTNTWLLGLINWNQHAEESFLDTKESFRARSALSLSSSHKVVSLSLSVSMSALIYTYRHIHIHMHVILYYVSILVSITGMFFFVCDNLAKLPVIYGVLWTAFDLQSWSNDWIRIFICGWLCL